MSGGVETTVPTAEDVLQKVVLQELNDYLFPKKLSSAMILFAGVKSGYYVGLLINQETSKEINDSDWSTSGMELFYGNKEKFSVNKVTFGNKTKAGWVATDCYTTLGCLKEESTEKFYVEGERILDILIPYSSPKKQSVLD